MVKSAKRPRLLQKTSNAFTIVELLVVIVVIGILAAISIVAYTGVSQKAISASLQSDLSSASTAIKLFQIDNSNYPTTISTNCSVSPDTLTNKCLKISNGNLVVGYSANNSSSPKTFLLIVNSGNYAYKVTENTAPAQLAQTMQPGVTPGAIVELHAAKANGGTGPGINSPLTTTWYDTSGNVNSGTLINFTGSPWSSDRLALDGTDDFVQTSPMAWGPDEITSELYMVPSAQTGGKIMFCHGSYNNRGWYWWRQAGGYVSVQLNDGSGNDNYNSSIPVLSIGVPVHIVMTYNYRTGYLKLYKDSSLVIDQPTTRIATKPTTQRLYLGTYEGTTGTYNYMGDYQLARIYPFALSAAQVTANYNAGADW